MSTDDIAPFLCKYSIKKYEILFPTDADKCHKKESVDG